MSRPLIYDITPLSRLAVEGIGGIDRVAFAYGQRFATTSRPGVWAAYFGGIAPHPIKVNELRNILQNTRCAWRDDVTADADQTFRQVLAWLGQPRSNRNVQSKIAPARQIVERASRLAFHTRYWIASAVRPLPAHAIYLNVFNAGREHRFLFDWLNRRPDVQPVFFMHDLLPFDFPEYFRPGYVELTRRRMATATDLTSSTFIAGTRVVADRLSDMLRQRGRREPRIHVAPLPSSLPMAQHAIVDATTPYFMMIGTIEPRKNHLLILNLWREFALRAGTAPKLIMIGGPGWENEQVHDMLERCLPIQPHVLRVDRISAAALTQLLANAQALLMPSFDEGYGLPVVEALTLGTPVIASDIPVFREISQGCATLLSPLDGAQWADAILALSGPQSAAWTAAKLKASRFHAPDWNDYFKGVEDFLDSL